MAKQKKIYSHEICITQSYNEGTGDHIYEVKKENFDKERKKEEIRLNEKQTCSLWRQSIIWLMNK